MFKLRVLYAGLSIFFSSLFLGSTAHAACSGSVISTAVTAPCTLGTTGDFTVQSTGSISGSAGSAINIPEAGPTYNLGNILVESGATINITGGGNYLLEAVRGGIKSPMDTINSITFNGVGTSADRGIYLNDFRVTQNLTLGSGSSISTAGIGIHLTDGARINGSLLNYGTLTAGTYGIAVGSGATIVGGIDNYGTIASTNGSSDSKRAINIDGTVSGTGITNHDGATITGSIIATSAARSLTINNSALIDGPISLSNTGYSNTINLTGTAGRITGAVAGTSTTVNVSGAFSTENTFNVQSFNVNNAADLTLNNNVTLVGGNTFTNTGNVTVTATNNPTITGNYSQSGTYTFGINSPTSYSILNVSRNASFSGGYSFALLSSSSLVANNLYRGILRSSAISGFSTQTYTQTLGGTSYQYQVLQDAANPGWLDLCYGTCLTGPDAANTLQSVQSNANGLSTIYNQQAAAYQAALTYDCQVYDENNLCVSAGGRYTYAGPSPSSNQQAGLVIVGYRPIPTIRVGAFADQSVNTTVPNGFKQTNNSPMWGLFAKWHMNADQTGLGVQASAVNSSSSLNVTRTQLTNTEAGSGTTQFNGQGLQLSTNYHQPITDSTALVPYLGLRYTRVNAGAYTENSSSTVTAPLSYNAMAQNSFSAIGGIGVKSHLAEKLTGTASVGIQQNLKYSMANYQGTSSISGLESFSVQMPGANNSMATATAGFYYDVNKRERLGFNVLWQQQPFIATNTTTALATYTIGF